MSNVASLRQIRRRIRSVENTRKITRAMEMAAAAKLHRFQDFLESARPYTEKIETLLDRVLATLPEYIHPYLGTCSGTGTPVLVLFTSDTGLCGTYNSELEGRAQQWIRENPDRNVQLVFVGKHGSGVLQRKGVKTLAAFSDLRVSRIDQVLAELGQCLEKAFSSGQVNEVFILYTKMENLSRYAPVLEKLLPFPREVEGAPSENVYLVEPDVKTVLDRLIPACFEARLRFIFYHALLTEQIARMSAMRQATKNAKDMIDELTLLRNKARQASITKEIIEVVSGSRALKLK